jgi:FkbM family methyltransferase
MLALASGVIFRRRPLRLPGLGMTVPMRFSRLAGGAFIRLGSSDLLVAHELFERGDYDAALALDLGATPTIVDLGANIGLSIRLWQQQFPGASILAVEPDAQNLALCRRNVAAGPSAAAVILVQACAAGRGRRVGLDRGALEWGIRLVEPDEAAPGEVDAVPMAALLERAGLRGTIELLKCDIEGGEAELFTGDVRWLGQVRWLLIETHAPYDLAALRADLRLAGFAFAPERLRQLGGASIYLGRVVRAAR